MATYNGGQYLSEQIESIIRQTYLEWQLIIRDDCSRDNTLEIIKKYAQRYPDKIKLIADESGNLGVSQNFLRLLSYSNTDYIMFCDQDDVWLPDKIKITFDKMKELELAYGLNTPGLIHTDLKVADEGLRVIAESFWKYQHLGPYKGRALNRLLVQNTITGCTVMINKVLKERIKFLPERVIIYDWWISLVATAFGNIAYIPSQTLLYRQHDNNSIGAKEWTFGYIKKMAMSGEKKLKEILLRTQLQAKLFLEVYKNELPEKDIDLITVYSTLNQQNLFIRRLNLIKYGFFKIGFRRNIGFLLTI
jgi:glycosyltransferase involved in cell wall biosynthesis